MRMPMKQKRRVRPVQSLVDETDRCEFIMFVIMPKGSGNIDHLERYVIRAIMQIGKVNRCKVKQPTVSARQSFSGPCQRGT